MNLYCNNVKIPYKGKIILRFYNPMFNDIGSHSFPISVSADIPSVNKAFGFPIQPEVADPGERNAIIRNGNIELIGSWEVNESQGRSIEAYFKGSSGDFYSLIKDKLLTDITYGGSKYPAGVGANVATVLAYMTTQMDAVYPDNDWNAFMAYMPNAIGGSSVEVNPVTHDAGTGVPRFTDTGTDRNSTVYLFAGAVVDYIFEEFGYRVEQSIFREDPDLKRLVIFNTFNRVAADEFDYTKLLPRILISDFLKALRDKFNVGFFINEQSKTAKILSFDSIITSSPDSYDFKIFPTKINKRKITGVNFDINAPDTWSSIPFTSVDELDPYATLVTYDKYRDLELAGIFSKKAFVKSEATYYDVDYLGTITRIGPDLFTYSDGDGSSDFSQIAGTLGLYTLEKNFETAVEYIIPYCDLTGNRRSYEYTPFPLIFLLSRGKQDCQVYPIGGAFERQYPMGTSDIYNAKGSAITDATLALRYHGTYGIIERFWENRIRWELNDKKIITAYLPLAELSRLLDFSKVIRAGNNNYLVNSVEVEMTNNVTLITEAELFRL